MVHLFLAAFSTISILLLGSELKESAWLLLDDDVFVTAPSSIMDSRLERPLGNVPEEICCIDTGGLNRLEIDVVLSPRLFRVLSALISKCCSGARVFSSTTLVRPNVVGSGEYMRAGRLIMVGSCSD